MAEATAQGMKPDACYCLQVIEATGIVTVPGSGFGQKEGKHRHTYASASYGGAVSPVSQPTQLAVLTS